VLSTGCSTLFKPLPPVNLQEPGWAIHQGQAVWKLNGKDTHDIAGDVIVATNPKGRFFVQFSKTPFPLLVGQGSANTWQVELPANNKRYSGRGRPPKRLIWLYLPRAMQGQSLPEHWKWTQTDSNWRLEDQRTGEAIEGFFSQ